MDRPLKAARIAVVEFLQSVWRSGSVMLVFISAATTLHANVYATDIKLNGSLYSITNASASPVIITYRLNQAATAGVTINILQGSTQVAAINGGTAMGLNTVSWTPAGAGTYSVSITARADGFPIWTQISVDTNAGMPAFYPQGIDVDKNTGSPYYGRVIMGCATDEGSAPSSVPLAAQKTGLYKMNADGTQADEGWYGNAGYTNDDGGDTPVAGQMPDSSGNNPCVIRIGDDDRIYWCDNSYLGAVIACDMQATTNQIVINEEGYADNPDFSDLNAGFREFDVTAAATANAAVWLCDNDSLPNWGIWMYHMAGGAADPKDTVGTQAVYAGAGSDLAEGSVGGCMVDANLDIFVSQNPPGNDVIFGIMDYTNWNRGVLPPEAGGFNYALGKANGQVLWDIGISDSAFCGIGDTVINSRTNPTMVALPMALDQDRGNTAFGIRVLNTANGSVVSVTNGATVQTLTNIDSANYYTCAAWDNVGNLYGASTTRFLWRVWSPPGSNQATTVAVAQVIIPTEFAITGITASPTTPGCATVAITFTATGNLAPSAFRLISSPTVKGAYTVVADATIAGGSGAYQATFSNCSTEFDKSEQVEQPVISGISASPTTSGCATLTITFTAPADLAPSAFKLISSAKVRGPYTAVVDATITGGSGVYQATFSNCSTGFYKIEQAGE
jgi:hypothetical protein